MKSFFFIVLVAVIVNAKKPLMNPLYIYDENTWVTQWDWGIPKYIIQRWVARPEIDINSALKQSPGPRNPTGDDQYLPSACSNGRSGPRAGYACPHMAMLSNDMISAAYRDGFQPEEILYAVAGGPSDGECGKCYQVQLLDGEREWDANFPDLVVQVINMGYDVLPYQLDIFMGGGGFGYFTACNQDCASHYCQGGACLGPGMYSGSSFTDWTTQSEYPDPNQCYSGGVKWDNGSLPRSQLVARCERLVGPERDWKTSATMESCVRSNQLKLHQNFVSTRVQRVRCPQNLVAVTGMRRRDDVEISVSPQKKQRLSESCQGDRSQGHYCITTMQDCCKPSCSWSGKVATKPGFASVDFCYRDGRIVGI